MLMIAPQGKEIGPACLKAPPPAGARNRRKDTVKIGQKPLLRFLPMIQLFNQLKKIINH